MEIKNKKEIPGYIKRDFRHFLYVEAPEDNFEDILFEEIMSQVKPSAPISGGVISERCQMILPDGTYFYGVSYKGDFDELKRIIVGGAVLLHLKTAFIDDEKIVISDGAVFKLDDVCFQSY